MEGEKMGNGIHWGDELARRPWGEERETLYFIHCWDPQYECFGDGNAVSILPNSTPLLN
jgi:hypothetical protein